MRFTRGRRAWAILVGLLVTSLLTPGLLAEGDKADPRVCEVGAKVEGKTHAEWSVVWWQWVSRIPKDRNPALDTTGKFAAEGQDGPVWFLAGNVGGKTVRKCVVPAGKPIFFPVVTASENAPPDRADEKNLLAEAKAQMDRMTHLEATLDGKPIAGLERFRVATGVFTLAGPEKASEAAFEDAVGKQKSAAEGYWHLLNSLPVGKHTLRFQGKLKEVGERKPFDLDISYELTVEKK